VGSELDLAACGGDVTGDCYRLFDDPNGSSGRLYKSHLGAEWAPEGRRRIEFQNVILYVILIGNVGITGGQNCSIRS
jgi:hypothetical protein